MSLPGFFRKVVIAATLSLILAGCESVSERAEAHYQNAIALLEQGDVDRGIVELRNVFQLDGSHKEARRLLAMTLINERQNRQGAYRQLLRLVEQYPDDLEARILLSELAFQFTRWDEFDRHGEKAEELAKDAPRVQVITLARQYRATVQSDDAPARRDLERQIESLLENNPENILLRSMTVDTSIRDRKFDVALSNIDWMLEREPENELYWRQRLNILVLQEDAEGIEAQLQDLVTRFPDDNEHKLNLMRLFLSRGEVDNAESFLRELVASSDENGPRVDLIRFLSEVRGPEETRLEVEKAIAEAENPVVFQVIGARLDFESGETDKAIATLEDVLKAAEDSEDVQDDIQSVKVTLAQMLLGVGNEVGARAQVENVLETNPSNAAALKMRASWLIQADDTDGAIGALRIALDTDPDDADAMTLMASAYARAGRSELAQDFLALAAEASGNAPEESIRYARQLISDERYLPAEDILLPALRLAPNNPQLLLALGQLYLAMDDLDRAEQVISALRALDTEVANQAANGIEAERINRQSGVEEAMAYLEGIAKSPDASLNSKIDLVRARIGTGEVAGALQLAREIQSEDPENVGLKIVVASTEALNGNLDAAEDIYREILDENANRPAVWLEMSRLLTRKGDGDAARATIDTGLQAVPESIELLWAKASYLERDGDVDGAIEIYQNLYEQDSSSMVIANNLASMLSTYRTDEDSLAQAEVIARRFRDIQAPAVQDTYGWILHRTGKNDEALPYLESAAAGLRNDPIVQFHLAKLYLALERQADALEQFQRVTALVSPADTRPQIVEAKDQIKALENQLETQPEN